MSKFKTELPVDVAALQALLPPGSVIGKRVWNEAASTLEMHWENDALRTGRDFPIAMPLEELRQRRNESAAAPPVESVPTAEAKPVAKAGKRK